MCMDTLQTWTEHDLREALDRYESELRTAGKARNTINTYVQHPERFINWLVGGYTPRANPARAIDDHRIASGSRSIYDPLREVLAVRDEPVVQMRFGQIESILGRSLPASARRFRPWWGNERAGTHVHAHAWLNAGRKTANVDLLAETVDFVQMDAP
jgi:hypothetical protein